MIGEGGKGGTYVGEVVGGDVAEGGAKRDGCEGEEGGGEDSFDV